MAPVASCLTVIYVLGGMLHSIYQPPGVGRIMAGASAVNATLFFATRVALARGAITPARAEPVVLVLALTVLGQALIHAALSPLAVSAAAVPAVLVGSAIVFVRRRWLVAYYALALGCCIVAIRLAEPRGRLFGMAIVVVTCIAVGFAMHLALGRAVRGLHAARIRERQHRRELDATVAALRAAEHRLGLALGELRRSNTELEQFASVASHDLKEPLRKVTSYLTLLSDRYGSALDQSGREFLDYARDGARRMQAQMDALLEYARVGAASLDPGVVALDAVVDAALRNLELAIGEAHAVVTRDPLPRVAADPAKLTQVLQNLLANAIRFRGEAAPEIHVSAERGAGEWTVAVRDNGIGIAKDHHESVFRIFERLHSRERYPGTGLGLAICKRIVERHGGRIWVESTPGQGATFRFTLPAAAGAAPDADP
jgi:signal transduction histidine kinase